MGIRLITFLLPFVSVGLMAQTSLAYTNNSLFNCDSNTYKEILFSDPGSAGPNQTWDYSHIQFNGKRQESILTAATIPKISGVGNYNLLLAENGYEYYMNSTENGLEECLSMKKQDDLAIMP